jgi:hypothetical protein
MKNTNKRKWAVQTSNTGKYKTVRKFNIYSSCFDFAKKIKSFRYVRIVRVSI